MYFEGRVVTVSCSAQSIQVVTGKQNLEAHFDWYIIHILLLYVDLERIHFSQNKIKALLIYTNDCKTKKVKMWR